MYGKTQINPRAFTALFDDLLNNGISKVFGDETGNAAQIAPVNIHETESAYELQLVAPGLNKEDFKVSVDRNLLTIAFEHNEQKDENGPKWLRKEYKHRSFKRSFTLNDKVDASNISARYNQGILFITLAKKEQAEPQATSINVE